jgi:hypothetical protein
MSEQTQRRVQKAGTDNFQSREKRVVQPHTTPSRGSFARVSSETDKLNYGSFYHCRETFYNTEASIDFLLMFHDPGKSQNICEFFWEFERRLGHSKLSDMGPTNSQRLTWIKPSDFWKRNAMRKSLVTILLRMGQEYNHETKNFEQALFSNEYYTYTTATRTAVNRFLQGYTWYSGSNTAWVNQFSGMTDQETVNSLLTKRPVTDEQLLRFAMKELGCANREQLCSRYRKVHHPMTKSEETTPENRPLLNVSKKKNRWERMAEEAEKKP